MTEPTLDDWKRMYGALWRIRLFEGHVPTAFGPLLDRQIRQSRCLTLRSDSAMRRLARRLFARELNGPLRRLTMEGVVLLLLAAQAMARGARVSLAPVTLEDIFLQVVGTRLDADTVDELEAA